MKSAQNYIGYVYLTTNLVNGKQYVGQHLANEFDKYYKGSGTYFKNALNKYGWDNFKCEILCWCSTQEELNYREQCEIFFYGTTTPHGYNIKLGGRQGGKLTKEGLINLSNAHKGLKYPTKRKICPFVVYVEYVLLEKSLNYINSKYGITHSVDVLESIGVKRRRCGVPNGTTPWNKGVKGTIPWNKGKKCEYISKAKKGKKRSEETCKKMSEALKGKPNLKARKTIQQFTKDGVFVKEWCGLIEIENELGFDGRRISLCCLNKPNHKTAYGFVWKHKNNRNDNN